MKHPIPLEITPSGEVVFEGKRVATRRSTRGYQHVQLPLHRLVAYVFHGPPPGPRFVCHHKDGNPHNNRADNLCWISQAENTRLHFKGRPRKLSPSQVDGIRAQYPGPVVKLGDLARSYGVSLGAVSLIRSGRNHKGGYSKTNRTKLTKEQVRAIRDWRAPAVTAASLGRKFHVSATVILNIWHGRY